MGRSQRAACVGTTPCCRFHWPWYSAGWWYTTCLPNSNMVKAPLQAIRERKRAGLVDLLDTLRTGPCHGINCTEHTDRAGCT
jgi:hypothetical protein